MNRKRSILFVLAIFILAGCATFSNVKPWSERTPQEKSLSFLQMYNKQYADTARLANTPNLSEAAKGVVRQKKALLTKIKPMIEAYDAIVAGGGTPSAEQEGAILDLIDRLTMGLYTTSDRRDELRRISGECAKRTNEKYAAEVAALAGRY